MSVLINVFRNRKFQRLLIGIYCLFIIACTAVIMIGKYDPSRNSLKALSSTSMDVICLIMLLVLALSITFDYHGHDRTTKLFTAMLLASIWAVFTDFLNWSFDGSLIFGQLTFWFTVLSLCMGSVLAGTLILYLQSYFSGNHGIDSFTVPAKICVVLNIISFVLTFILAITGTAFEFVDGHYTTGVLYDVVTVFPVLTLLIFAALIVRNIKKIGLHDVLAVVGYIVFMITGAIIEADHGIGTSYVSVTIADIFIFVMLQNQVIVKEKQNVITWMTRSNTDQLTGLYNRRAYEADINALISSVIEDDFVYVSIDVNSLKAANDTLGHAAGDELLIGTADCMKKVLGAYGKLYRIGGDEFIALIYADEDILTELKKELSEMTASWHGKAVNTLSLSCGYVSKSEAKDKSLQEMAVIADERMYEEKRAYYKRTGIERRKE